MSSTRAYRSKIGRLPFAVRNELNERIRDGATGSEILKWLNTTPEYRRVMRSDKCGEVNATNLTEWRGSGYKDWLADQAQADRIRKAAEIAQTLTSASGSDPAAVAARIAAASLIEIVTNPDDPKALNEASRTIASLRSAELLSERTQISQRKLALDAEALELDKEKFRRQTCELFLKWFKDKRAVQIAEGKGSNEDKIKALLAHMDKMVEM